MPRIPWEQPQTPAVKASRLRQQARRQLMAGAGLIPGETGGALQALRTRRTAQRVLYEAAYRPQELVPGPTAAPRPAVSAVSRAAPRRRRRTAGPAGPSLDLGVLAAEARRRGDSRTLAQTSFLQRMRGGF